MVRLGVEGDLSAFEAVDDVHLPQRAAAIEQRGVQPCDKLLELHHGSGTTQGNGAHVVIEVDVVVLDPHRFSQLERHLRQLARKYRSEVQTVAEHSLHFIVVITRVVLRKLEQHQAADMHRRLRCLEMQE